jgi:hypothetical protein
VPGSILPARARAAYSVTYASCGCSPSSPGPRQIFASRGEQGGRGDGDTDQGLAQGWHGRGLRPEIAIVDTRTNQRRDTATYVSRRGAQVVETKHESVLPVSDDLAAFPAAPADTASPFETSYRVQGVRNDPQAA